MKKSLISLACSYMLLISAVMTLGSCKREPLHEPFSNYYLVLEGKYESLHVKPSVPGMYEAVFYDKATHVEVAQSYLGTNGGYIYDIAPGTYEMIVYSFDSGNTKVSGLKSYPEASATTERYSEGDTKAYNTPDHLIVARDENFVVPFLFDRSDPYYLYAYPETIVESWCLVVDGIKGLRNAAAIEVYFTGQARSKELGPQNLEDKATTVHTHGMINAPGTLIYTPFCTFGKLPEKNSTLRLVITDQNQKTVVVHADVTDQFDDPANTGRWIKVHCDLEIEPKKDGGMRPDVKEWEENVFNYEIY